MAAPALSSPFVYAVCQPGAETALKDEVTRAHPALRFAYSRPGLVTWRSPTPLALDTRLDAVFARLSGLGLGPAPDEAAVLAGARRLADEPVRLHVFGRDAARGTRAAAVEAAIRAAAGPETFLTGSRAQPGDRVLDVIVSPATDEPAWLGAHLHRADRSPWPGGGWIVDEPLAMPSRAYRKLSEAIAWSRVPLRPGDVAVEIGSAPGGASYALLQRGLEVIGVDPGAMAPVVLGFEGPSGNRFRHLPLTLGALRREALPARVQWLVLDVNLAPQVALHGIRRLVAALRGDLVGVLFTLKLNDWAMARAVPDLLARVAAMGLSSVRATQLPSNRQEIFVTGEGDAAASRRKPRQVKLRP